MSYINAFQDGDEIVIIERDENDNRVVKRQPIEYKFYLLEPYGNLNTIFGESCTEYTFDNRKDFYHAIRRADKSKVFEHDANHVYRYLSEHYDFDSLPNLHVSYYDIEVEWTEETKYSNQDRAENKIISVAVYNDWEDKMYCLALPPPMMTYDEAFEVVKHINKTTPDNTRTLLYENEADMMHKFFQLIEDSDVISGWNSEGYDFKYIYNRIPKIMDEKYRKELCLLGYDPKEKSGFNDKTKSHYTFYQPVGRVHLDYMNLYKKYTYSELTSYALDNIAYIELDQRKVEYDDTLHELYNFDFENFIRYNIKDTLLVYKLDEKLKFISLSNLLAHNNGVTMDATLGTVAITEQAILNQGHYYSDNFLVFPSRPDKEHDDIGAAGAFVVEPKVGRKKHVSGIDINSLYPSAIRATNMSTETLIAQVLSTETDKYLREKVESGECKTYTEAWQPLFSTFEYEWVRDRDETKTVTVVFNRTNDRMTVTADKVHDMVFGSDEFVITANGTIFSRDKKGVIPALLERWYSERQVMQAKKEEAKDQLELAKTDDEIKEAQYWVNYWDQRQMAKKINLNALYGALLNENCRFYDKRIGQSTTLTGRSITRHMASKTNELITGEYTEKGDAVIYGDTDSILGTSNITTDFGVITVESLFDICDLKWNNGEKEYAFGDVKILNANKDLDTQFQSISYVYRHKVSKDMYEITTESGHSVHVTEDHSIMQISEDGILLESKPTELQVGSEVLVNETEEN